VFCNSFEVVTISMGVDVQVLYNQIGQHLAQFPDTTKGFPPELRVWIQRAAALIKAVGDGTDTKNAREISDRASTRSMFVDGSAIHGILQRTFYELELQLPVGQQGAFIPAGNAHDAFAAVGRLLKQAQTDVLIIDPYMDSQALTTYAVTALDQVAIRLLADSKNVHADLKPAVTTWKTQYTQSRSLESRLTAPRKLHDRFIIVDNATVWMLTQSLNAFAKRSPATIIQVADQQIAGDKIAHYTSVWNTATPI
jgi:hypothetical protein